MLSINDQQFIRLTDYLKSHFGVNLIKKRTLIESRLNNYLVRNGFVDYETYLDYAFGDVSGKEITQILNLLTTNYSYFMREWEHFKFFRDRVLPELAPGLRDGDLRTWSAGCSTGQEPYTLAMILADFMHDRRLAWDAKVLATDISDKALSRAKEGVYQTDCLKNVPAVWKLSYFNKISDSAWAVKNQLKSEVIFRRFNLIEEAFPFKKKFHVIFCRNVMIYFAEETKKKLISKFFDATANGGYLFIGQSESLNKDETDYQFIMPSIYKKVV
jgi:chemotaxis protein methyltransferase CheR